MVDDSYFSSVCILKKASTIATGAVCLICLSLVLLTCGKKEKEAPPSQESTQAAAEQPFYADTLLPGDIQAYEIRTVAPVEKVLRNDADSLLGPKAKHYLSYNLVGLASAGYEVQNVPVQVEIAQFAAPEDAYGFYASLRPDGIGTAGLGTESFSLDTSLYFTKGEFVVALSARSENDTLFAARSLLGHEIDSRIPGNATAPQFFILFPFKDKIVPSAKYYPGGFLNVDGLDEVYTISYFTGGDTAVFFLTVDDSGEKFLRLRDYAESVGKVSSAPETFAFVEGYSISFKHPSHGTIVAGLVRSKLVGIIGYDATKNDRLATMWVQGLR